MGPEIPTAAADQNFAWICKQHRDLIGSVLSFRAKIIWSGPEFGLVRCGYLNTAIYIPFIYYIPKKKQSCKEQYRAVCFVTTVHLFFIFILYVTTAQFFIFFFYFILFCI